MEDSAEQATGPPEAEEGTTLTTRFVDGAPNRIDVGTSDVEGAASFHGGLFGWEFAPAGPGADGYGFFRRAGRIVAGGMRTAPEQGPPAWTVYFRSPDADATAKAVQQARGSVPVTPMEMTGRGRTAILADQADVSSGIREPATLEGIEAAGEVGTLRWAELHTPDIARTAALHHSVLGRETSAVTFPDGVHTCVNPAGTGEDGMSGGLVPSADDPTEAETGRPHWLPASGRTTRTPSSPGPWNWATGCGCPPPPSPASAGWPAWRTPTAHGSRSSGAIRARRGTPARRRALRVSRRHHHAVTEDPRVLPLIPR